MTLHLMHANGRAFCGGSAGRSPSYADSAATATCKRCLARHRDIALAATAAEEWKLRQAQEERRRERRAGDMLAPKSDAEVARWQRLYPLLSNGLLRVVNDIVSVMPQIAPLLRHEPEERINGPRGAA